jgi:type III secretion protein V
MVLERIAARQELALVGVLVLTIAMMMLPVPTALADVLIASNIGFALLLMMVAIYVSSPVEFSTLPTVILITTAFRLSLSITTSRMVLVQGDAGEIIRTFGEFVIAGNVVVGLVVYLIITIVQFVVITKGSERVAEVAARFTLDAMPGKQISIDTDLKNGDIDQNEARQRRASRSDGKVSFTAPWTAR